MDKFDVIIVGAGPTGIFAAYELVRNRPSLNICLVELGNLIKNRERHEVMSGVGGAGTFSDGKLHYTPVLSHEKMFHLYPAHEYCRNTRIRVGQRLPRPVNIEIPQCNSGNAV